MWESNPRVPEPQSGALTTSPIPPSRLVRLNQHVIVYTYLADVVRGYLKKLILAFIHPIFKKSAPLLSEAPLYADK